MKIFDFCKKYNSFKNSKLRDEYLNNHLEIKPYLSFLEKDALAQNVVNASVYKWEDYTTEDGKTSRRMLNQIELKSVAKRLLFVKAVIEKYTNLESETENFCEEYDELVQSGLIDLLMISNDQRKSLIPENEIAEIDYFINLKTDDAIANSYEPHAYISNQISRISELATTTLSPFFEKIIESIGDLNEEDTAKLANAASQAFKIIK